MTALQLRDALRLRGQAFRIEAVRIDDGGTRWRLTIGGRPVGTFPTWHAAEAARKRAAPTPSPRMPARGDSAWHST